MSGLFAIRQLFSASTGCVIIDMPDHASVATPALVIASTGAIAIKTTVLLTPEDMDAAAKKTPAYRAPGQ